MGADGGSSPATSNQQQAALLPARRTGSLRRPSTDSAFDVAEQLPPPLPPPSPLRSSQPAARPGPKQHADLLLQRLPGDAGTAALSQASGGDDERGGDGDLQERPSMMQCVECTAGISPAIADAPASAAPAPPAFCSPLRHISAVGSPGTSATDGSPSLPCPAAYVLRRGGIEGPAVPATAPRPRRLSGLYAPPAAQHPAASPVMRNSNWVSSGAAASAGGINGAVGNSTTSGTTAAAAAVPEAPLSPTGAAVVFVHATAANAAVMAALSSDRSQVAAAAACALTSDGGSVAGSVAGSASGAAARNGAAVKSSSGGAGAAGKRYPASVCGGSAQPVSRAGRVTTQRSATSTRQSAAGAYAGGGGGGAGTVSSGSSSAVGGLHGAGGALPRYLQPTASFAAKQARK
ncbi:hypothetical protein HXX76_008816 [Chlamydomonas incerta]|uniref:Uncharacterized protein n=1 Tax=Chlamydomonas incerta TaxID=51695 RepID=A0A835T6G4_CHLIN|nr:hypothetical protein HXX76_008816 [Chlamydomonas incerta]|eukprot:KAG2432471.1 hypothetical protein HXX76_008816 [Chlamydomonas incerta]